MSRSEAEGLFQEHLKSLIGLSTGLVVGVAQVFVDGEFTGTNLALGILTAGGGWMLGYLREIRELREQHIARSDRLSQLMSGLERCSLSEDALIELCNAAANVEASRYDDFVKTWAEQRIDAARQQLVELHNGTMVREGEDNLLLLERTNKAIASIDATSIGAVDRSFWQGRIGQQYLDAMQRAIEDRSVAIRRVFVVRGHLDEETRYAMRQQIERGIDVRWLDGDTIESSHRIDFILFDRSFSYEVDTEVGTSVITKTYLRLDRGLVESRSELFERLWTRGSPLLEDAVTA